MFSLNEKKDPKFQQNLVLETLEKIGQRLKTNDASNLDGDQILDWIKIVLNNAIELSNDETLDKDPPDSLDLTKEIAAYVIQKMIHILMRQNDIRDNGLYYLNDTGAALNISAEEMRNLLDDEFNKLRYQFTTQLKVELDSEKLYWCALILMKIICADGQIHPAEKEYFDVVQELIKDMDTNLQELEKVALKTEDIPKLSLNTETAISMLKYVVTIAMCDGEYVGQESEFITKAADSLGIEHAMIDQVLQPIAATFMVLESLFPKAAKK